MRSTLSHTYLKKHARSQTIHITCNSRSWYIIIQTILSFILCLLQHFQNSIHTQFLYCYSPCTYTSEYNTQCICVYTIHLVHTVQHTCVTCAHHHSCITLYTPVFLTSEAPITKRTVAFSAVSSITLMLKEQFTSIPNDISGSCQATCRLVFLVSSSIVQPVMVTLRNGPGRIAKDSGRGKL